MILLIPCLISVTYVAVIIFLYAGLLRLTSGKSGDLHSFSVVIAARNEEDNITACLTSVLAQSIGKNRFEVILVNDRSTDQTLSIAQNIAANNTNLSIITIDKTPSGVSPKKHAVLQGVLLAKNDIIVFTDADCIVPPCWLETIGAYFDNATGLVQGITTYFLPTGMNKTFFGLQAVDFLSHGIVAASAIGAGLPINSNANNFSFRKVAFKEASGYGSHNAIISGDDDLLLQRIWKNTKWQIRFMTDPKGAVSTAPSATIKAIFEQRKRWGSKTVHYNMQQVLLLSAIFLFYLCIPTLFAAGFVYHPAFVICAGMLALKIAGEFMLMIPGTRIFAQTALRKYILVGSLIQLPMVLIAAVSGVFGKFGWKGQKFGRIAK